MKNSICGEKRAPCGQHRILEKTVAHAAKQGVYKVFSPFSAYRHSAKETVRKGAECPEVARKSGTKWRTLNIAQDAVLGTRQRQTSS